MIRTNQWRLKVFAVITARLISTTCMCIIFSKKVWVEAPVEFVEQLIWLTSRQTHNLLLSICSLSFLVCLLHGDSSFYRHLSSQLGVKCTFLHTSCGHTSQQRCQIRFKFFFPKYESWPWWRLPLLCIDEGKRTLRVSWKSKNNGSKYWKWK